MLTLMRRGDFAGSASSIRYHFPNERGVLHVLRHFRWLGVLLLVLVLAGSAWAQSFSNFFVFGDSLSDSGNAAQAQGVPGGVSFTTNPDPVWAEIVARTFGASGENSLAGGPNYAVAGACMNPGYALRRRCGAYGGGADRPAPRGAGRARRRRCALRRLGRAERHHRLPGERPSQRAEPRTGGCGRERRADKTPSGSGRPPYSGVQHPRHQSRSLCRQPGPGRPGSVDHAGRRLQRAALRGHSRARERHRPRQHLRLLR